MITSNANVQPDFLARTDSPVKSLDVASTANSEILPVSTVSSYINIPQAHYHAKTHNMKSVTTKTESDITSQPTVRDIVWQDSNAGEASATAEIQISAATNDKAQGSPKAFTDLDYLDGPAVMAEVYPFFHMRVSSSLGCGSCPSHMRQGTTVRRLE